MIKVCFTIGTSNPKSSITRVVVNIANLLVENNSNYEVHFLCVCKMKDNFFAGQSPKIILDSLNTEENKFAKYVGAMLRIKQYIKKNQIHVIIISGMQWVPFYYMGLKNLAVHMVAWEHRNFFAGSRYRLEWFGKRIACRNFSGIINISKRDYMQYRKYSQYANLFQIYNVCRIENRCTSYHPDAKKIITVGCLAPVKGVDMLIDIAEKILPKYPDWSWDIYGEGELRQALQEKIKKKGLQDQLHLMGWHDNVDELYHEYSIYVMTSRMEGMGMVLIEAQKNRLPVISFDVLCGPSDVVVDSINGFLIPPFELDTMAERITQLIEDKELRQSFSDHAGDRHGELERAYILQKWQDMIETVVGNDSYENVHRLDAGRDRR